MRLKVVLFHIWVFLWFVPRALCVVIDGFVQIMREDKMGKVDEKLLTAIPVEKATTPFDGAYVYANRWWIVRDGCVLFFCKFAPQCNPNKEITERLRDRLYPGAEVRFLPVVFAKMER